jgi:hypothetical protein
MIQCSASLDRPHRPKYDACVGPGHICREGGGRVRGGYVNIIDSYSIGFRSI